MVPPLIIYLFICIIIRFSCIRVIVELTYSSCSINSILDATTYQEVDGITWSTNQQILVGRTTKTAFFDGASYSDKYMIDIRSCHLYNIIIHIDGYKIDSDTYWNKYSQSNYTIHYSGYPNWNGGWEWRKCSNGCYLPLIIEAESFYANKPGNFPFSPQFKCDNYFYNLTNRNVISLDLTNKIYFSNTFKGGLIDSNRQIAFIGLTGLKGKIKSNLNNISDNIPYPIDSLTYEPPSYSSNEECYYETVTYYIDRDYINNNEDDCKQPSGQTLSFLVCGHHCKYCNYNSGQAYCEECDFQYAFFEDETNKCVLASDYTSSQTNPYFLDQTNNINHLYPCYETCSSCSGNGTLDEHNCINCKASNNSFLVLSSGSINCYSSCQDWGLWQENNENKCLTTCSPDLYEYRDVGKCVTLCSNFNVKVIYGEQKCIDDCKDLYKYQIGKDPICTSECNETINYPFYSEDTPPKCIQQCPHYYYSNNCTTVCPESHPYRIQNSNECLGRCDPPLYYVDDGTANRICVSTCSSVPDLYEMVVNSTYQLCTNNCRDATPNVDILHKKCVDSCPYLYPNSNVCVSGCNGQYYLEDNINHLCVDTCPNDAHLISLDQKECVDECPPDTFISIDGKKCLIECDNIPPLTLGTSNQCITGCDPVNYPLLDIENNRCVSTCQEIDMYLLNGQYCVSSCEQAAYNTHYIENGECTTSCSAINSYIDTDRMECISSCSILSGKNYILPNNECVNACTPQFQFITPDNHCVASCQNPTPYIFDGNKCVSDCQSLGQYIGGDQIHCVTTCKNEELKYLLVNDEYCSDSCPSPYDYLDIDNQKCVSQCDSNQFYFKTEKKCVSNCIDPYPYKGQSNGMNYCTDNCQEYNQVLKLNTNECDSQCAYSNEYVLPPYNKCVLSCDDDYPYYNDMNNFCVKECTGGNGYVDYSTNHCTTGCTSPNVYELGDTKQCVDKCTDTDYPYKSGSNKCLQSCGGDLPYLNFDKTECFANCDELLGEYFFGNSYQCVRQCGEPYEYLNEDNSTCVNQCDIGKLKVEGTDKKCVSSCPFDYPYTVNNECVANCKDTVFQYYYNSTTDCVQSCALGDYFEIKEDGTKICYTLSEGCPPEKPIVIDGTGECVNICSGDKPYINSSMECVEQCDNYIKEGSYLCLSDCLDDNLFLYGNTNLCVSHCKDQFPILIPEQSKCSNECPDPYYLNYEGTECIHSCITPYNLILPDTKKCVDTCDGTSTPYQSENSNICTTTCEHYIDLLSHRCVNQCTKYSLSTANICVDQCPSDLPYLADTVCYSSCPSSHPFLNEDTKQCFSNCRDDPYNNDNLLQYKNKCVKECPQFTIQNQYECIFSLSFGEEVKGIIPSELNKEEILSILDVNILDLLNMEKIIQGDDFFLEVYTSSNPLPENALVSSLNFSQCEIILREKYQIPSNTEIIIAKIDTVSNKTVSSQVDYRAYTEDGDVLDTFPCKEIISEVSTPLQINNFNYSLGYNLYLLGYDIFDPNDDFYNNICGPFIVNDTDVCLSDRRKYFYQDIQLCEQDCEYIGIDYKENKVNCDCKTKQGIIFDRNHSHKSKEKDTFLKDIFPHNTATLKCYALFFKWKYIKNCLVYWLGLLLSITSIVLAIVVYVKQIDTLFNKITLYTNSNPPNEYFPPNNLIYRTTSDSKDILDNETVFSIGHSKHCKYNELTNEELFKKNNGQSNLSLHNPLLISEKKNIDNYSFPQALNEDNRNLCLIFYSQLITKILLFKHTFIHSSFDILLIKITQYLIYFISVYIFNAILFSDNLISKRFINKGKFSISIYFCRGILSLIISLIIYSLMMSVSSYINTIETIVIDVKDKYQLMKLSKKMVISIKKKITLLFSIELALSLFGWYYLSLFAIVYPATQFSWFYCALSSFCIFFCISFLVSFFTSVLRKLGLKWSSQLCYNISLFLQDLW